MRLGHQESKGGVFGLINFFRRLHLVGSWSYNRYNMGAKMLLRVSYGVVDLGRGSGAIDLRDTRHLCSGLAFQSFVV